MATKGRGPGEIQDASGLKTDPQGNLVIYDQMNSKVVKYFSDQSNSTEFTLANFGEFQNASAFPTPEENIYLLYQSDSSQMREVDQNRRLLFYNQALEEPVNSQIFPSRKVAPIYINDNLVGGRSVPFSSTFVFDFSKDMESMYISWTENNEIAEIDFAFDTLRTIPINLEKEIISKAEIDSMRNDEPDFWDDIEKHLPEYKSPYDDLIVDHKNQVWLKLTRASDYMEWLVLDTSGTPINIVQFPKKGMLTHVSEHHIGFRADDHIFSIYEPIE